MSRNKHETICNLNSLSHSIKNYFYLIGHMQYFKSNIKNGRETRSVILDKNLFTNFRNIILRSLIIYLLSNFSKSIVNLTKIYLYFASFDV